MSVSIQWRLTIIYLSCVCKLARAPSMMSSSTRIRREHHDGRSTSPLGTTNTKTSTLSIANGRSRSSQSCWIHTQHSHGSARYSVQYCTYIIENKAVNNTYSMLLGQPWLIWAKVTHDWRCQQVIINGNGTVWTIPINLQIDPRPKLPEVLVYYNFTEGLTEQQESSYLESEEDLISIGDITLLDFIIQDSLLDSVKRDLSYRSTLGDIEADNIPIELKVHGQPLHHGFRPNMNQFERSLLKHWRTKTPFASTLICQKTQEPLPKKSCGTTRISLHGSIVTTNAFRLIWTCTRSNLNWMYALVARPSI